MLASRAFWSIILLSCLASACQPRPKIPGTDRPATRLSEMGLFEGPLAAQRPAAGVVPFDVNSPLFSDETVKHRFLRVPPGQTLAYSETERWGLPVGTILVKTFAYPRDARDPGAGEQLLETRLLVQEPEGLRGYTFVWNREQTDAVYTPEGSAIDVSWTDAAGRARTIGYRVPPQEACALCHRRDDRMIALGLRTAQLNRTRDYGRGPEEQLAHLEALGLLAPAPSQSAPHARMEAPFGDAPVPLRARSYLDANCAHCHTAGGLAGLAADVRFDFANADELALGVCAPSRRPLGGRRFEIVPGRPDESVLVLRMESSEPELRMPIGFNRLVDAEGVALVRAWIAGLAPRDCAAPR